MGARVAAAAGADRLRGRSRPGLAHCGHGDGGGVVHLRIRDHQAVGRGVSAQQPGAVADRANGVAGAVPQRELLRPVPRDDHRPAGDRDRRE